MNLLCGCIPFEHDIQQGLAEFIEHFDYVWWLLPDADREAIQSGIKRIVWTANNELVDPAKRNTIALCKNLGERRSEILFYAPCLIGGHARHFRNIIAHELRHAWQFATDYRSSADCRQAAMYMTLEADARGYAKTLIGPESNHCDLQDRYLPTDDEFDRLADHWRLLTDAQRLEVLALAAGLKAERIYAADDGNAISNAVAEMRKAWPVLVSAVLVGNYAGAWELGRAVAFTAWLLSIAMIRRYWLWTICGLRMKAGSWWDWLATRCRQTICFLNEVIGEKGPKK